MWNIFKHNVLYKDNQNVSIMVGDKVTVSESVVKEATIIDTYINKNGLIRYMVVSCIFDTATKSMPVDWVFGSQLSIGEGSITRLRYVRNINNYIDLYLFLISKNKIEEYGPICPQCRNVMNERSDCLPNELCHSCHSSKTDGFLPS